MWTAEKQSSVDTVRVSVGAGKVTTDNIELTSAPSNTGLKLSELETDGQTVSVVGDDSPKCTHGAANSYQVFKGQ
jgi:hypothetical protein